VNPEALTPDLILELVGLVRDPSTDDSLRIGVARALLQRGQLEREPFGLELIQPLLVDLQRDDMSMVRRSAADALFALCAGAPHSEPQLRAELQKMRASRNPQRRITAAKLWEMLELGRIVRTAGSDGEEINPSMPSLDELRSSTEEHLTFAAHVAASSVPSIVATHLSES
jgi:HEAT repeat protein